MRKVVLAGIGAAVLIVACSETRDSIGDQLTSPLFTHISQGCRAGDALVDWPQGTAPDDNNNAKVCQKNTGALKKAGSYYDDINHTAGPPKKVK